MSVFDSCKKLGCFLSLFAKNDSEIKVDYCILSDPKFKYLRPKGTIIKGIDRKHNIPMTDKVCASLAKDICTQRLFFVGQRHAYSELCGSSNEIGYDTVF